MMEGTMWTSLREKLEPMPTGHAVLGISGGADSVALLYLLIPEVQTGRLQLEAVHVNHGLRGDASDQDMLFSEALCAKLGIPWRGYRPDLHGKADENTAREARYACFRECMTESGADTLILAHHADDQAETYLIRLLRGAGPEGLGCMQRESRDHGIRILRPMLGLRREEIRKFLTENGIIWREDESNQDTRYLRNRIRSVILPEMERDFPGAVGRIAATAEMTADENRAMDEIADRLIQEYAGSDWFRIEGLANQPEGIRVRTLRKWWKQYVPELKEHTLNRTQSKMLSSLTEAPKGTKINLPGGSGAVRGAAHLHLTGKEHFCLKPVDAYGDCIKFGDFTLRTGEYQSGTGDGKIKQAIPENFLNGCVIRTRKPGDRIRPFGSPDYRKLQDYLTDRKVDVSWRDRIPLLCRGNEVIMVCGVGTGNVPKLDPETVNRFMVWTGPMPWVADEKRGISDEKERKDL